MDPWLPGARTRAASAVDGSVRREYPRDAADLPLRLESPQDPPHPAIYLFMSITLIPNG